MIATSYLVLFTLTFFLGFLAILVHHKTREPGFLLGTALLYYWSLYGAWFLIIEKSGGASGMRYQYLEDKLFPIELGSSYLSAIVYYGLFIAFFQFAILFFTRPQNTKSQPLNPKPFSHTINVMVGILLTFAVIFIIKEVYEGAQAHGMAAYRFKYAEGQSVSRYTIFQILVRAALTICVVGSIIAFAKNRNRYFIGEASTSHFVGYGATISILFLVNMALGAKNEITCALLTGALFYLSNGRRVNYTPLVVISIFGITVFSLVDFLRGLPTDQQLDTILNMSYEDWSLAIGQVFTSNEAFGAHFSMYGAIANEVPLTHGASIVTLISGLIPRFLWPNRPTGVYEHYVEHVGATAGQGYSIHHATGWYLNFGVMGVIAGGLMLGVVASILFNIRNKDHQWRWVSSLATLGLPIFIGYFPVMIRGGIEVYKGAIIDVFILPTLLWVLSMQRREKRSLNKLRVRLAD